MAGRRRHIAKTLTWRLVATGTTFLLTLLFFKENTNSLEKASWLAGIEASVKMLLYYYHERLWFLLKLKINSYLRHLFKTITWRVIASLTTFIIAFLIFRNDPFAVWKALSIAGFETVIKMLFYYLHERAWHLSKFDLEKR